MDGIILIDKPQGMTSHDAVSFLRRLTGVKKIGHTGTLDPLATGVLPLCIGKATRVIEFIDADESHDAKVYECVMQLGIATDTQDITGTVISDILLPESQPVTVGRITDVLMSFAGAQKQLPPMYSAIKYKGRKLYEYARSGEELPDEALKLRDVYISSITVNSIDLQENTVAFTVASSRGTYVRTICHDAGIMLGVGAAMKSLRRVKSGAFTIDRCHSTEALEEMRDELPLIPMDEAIPFLPVTELSAEAARLFQNGIKTDMKADTEADIEAEEDGMRRIYAGGSFIGIGKAENGLLKPYKVIVTE
ncbi:MAG: tRNA pseudouridine(55) synthase TruB [Clostridiales Family XIII bacterium]|jgi:tRNA pseudouridine55 synthase|nr:tRNA pseudouridine(55) synthase TruB [Clostridiales Family XIII bacterium]